MGPSLEPRSWILVGRFVKKAVPLCLFVSEDAMKEVPPLGYKECKRLEETMSLFFDSLGSLRSRLDVARNCVTLLHAR